MWAGTMNTKALNTAAPFEVAGYRVEPSILRVTRAGEHTRLESKAMQVLVYLFEHAGLVVSRSELEESLWPGRIVTEDAVTNAIAKLRRVFGDDARKPQVIETVPKIGYRLIACTYRIALGTRAGQKVLSLQSIPSFDAQPTQKCCANHQGLSLHAAVRCAMNQRNKLEQLCRYITRPAIANERLKLNAYM